MAPDHALLDGRCRMASRADAPTLASRFARIALANVVREYPGKPDHVLAGAPTCAAAARAASRVLRQLRLALVRAHALAARARAPAASRRCPSAPRSTRCSTPPHGRATSRRSARTSRGRSRASFERTYGWAWLLELARELARRRRDAQRWARALAPLADAFVARYLDYLPRQRYPLRYGLHANSAFGLAFALDYARARRDDDLRGGVLRRGAALVRARSRRARGVGASGADFLSPALMEADLMRRVLAARRLRDVARRLPSRARAREPARCSRRRSSTTAATATSCISTASTCRARGACAASRARCRADDRARSPRCGAAAQTHRRRRARGPRERRLRRARTGSRRSRRSR